MPRARNPAPPLAFRARTKKETTMPNAPGKGTGEPGWTPEEMGQDASGQPGVPGEAKDAGEAGDARPKGRPSDDREATETAASRQDQEAKRD